MISFRSEALIDPRTLASDLLAFEQRTAARPLKPLSRLLLHEAPLRTAGVIDAARDARRAPRLELREEERR